jgi:Asp-tRNA(Asn)/Glu-tRNA(Gln) amidotransferase A subunit family amidase
MYLAPAPLAPAAADLRAGALPLDQYISEKCAWLESADAEVHALLPEVNRRRRLLHEAEELERRYPDPASRPPLYGILVGVKDIIHVEGYVTRAGSAVPPELFAGPEATVVGLLRAAGALILGKTVTTEFAGFEQNGTRNPHNLGHTPGGSSSGSAAAVAAGFCSLALGSQTVGSVIRPAAFCGVVGLKPTYDRIPTAGIVYYSPSVDHIGLFTQDVAGMAMAAAVLCRDWQPATPDRAPVLGVPEGAYLEQASPEGLEAFEQQVVTLEQAGYIVRRVPALDDIAAITERHTWMATAEMAAIHADWFPAHQAKYRPVTAETYQRGTQVTTEQLAAGRESRMKVRTEIQGLMDAHGIDLWVCPPAPGPAPEGIQSTGNPAMNLPWTHTGMPAITVPAGKAANGLPLGLQCVARADADESLLAWAAPIGDLLRTVQ